MANELTVTKEEIARYVHAAVEMETAVFTIEKMIDKCESEQKNIQDNAKTEHDKCFAKANQLSNQIADARKRLKSTWNAPDFKLDWGEYWKHFFITVASVWFPVLLITLWTIEGLGYMLVHHSLMESSYMPLFVFYFVVLYIISIIYIPLLIQKHEHHDFIKRLINEDHRSRICAQESLSKLLPEYKTACEAMQQAELHCDKAYIEADILANQIQTLSAKQLILSDQLNKFYHIGVIPPDYRTMKCAIMLDWIFRNDLADTMRDAIMIYEERDFHNTVVGGMKAFEQCLNSVNSNVEMMRQDLCTIFEGIAAGQAKLQKATEELMNETRMSRYATEQVAESAKNLEWHERRRQGWG